MYILLYIIPLSGQLSCQDVISSANLVDSLFQNNNPANESCVNRLSTSKCRFLKHHMACITHEKRMQGYCDLTCGFCGMFYFKFLNLKQI